MKVLLDEGVPLPLLELLRIDELHQFDHVIPCSMAGQSDPKVFRYASTHGFEALVALDRNQLNYEHEWRALRRARLHHLSLRQRRSTKGERGALRILASLALAMPRVLDHLDTCTEPQIVDVALLSDSSRFESISHHRHEQAQARVR